MIAALTAAAILSSQPISAGPLAGTLSRPPKIAAVMLILPGSGPTDRDGNNPMGVIAAPYRMLAEGLAKRGIATVRIDKRGMFGSKAATANPNDVTFADYAADTEAWVTSARKATGAKCVWLAGHSEGALVALRSANQDGICGLVLISSPGRPVAVLMREQIRANPANSPIFDDAERAISSLERGQSIDVAAMNPALSKGLFNPAVQPFLIDMMRQNPTAELKAYKGPVLIIAGSEDLQVAKADRDALAGARKDVTVVTINGMNHVLKLVPAGDRAANLASYAASSLPVAPRLIDTIADFVRAKRK